MNHATNRDIVRRREGRETDNLPEALCASEKRERNNTRFEGPSLHDARPRAGVRRRNKISHYRGATHETYPLTAPGQCFTSLARR